MTTASMITVLGAVMLGVLIMAVSSYACAHSGVAYSVGVGDPVCWSIPPRPDYYTNWSDSHFFKIGDTLVFNFEGGLSNVVQVTKQDYETCTAYRPFRIFNNGLANITLLDKGVLYFITNVSNYCSLGQKISISVHDCACPVNEPPSAPSVSPTPAALPPSSISPNRSQPPAAQVITPSGAPSPLGYNGSSPQTRPAVKSAASMLQKGMMLGVLHAILFGSVSFGFWSSY
ncbi:cucumber peeling cupredoxin-like [Argentina anserina]|uniref:cucumber peeling cupredoxin-like n=1 Tax=Argentina anserina TaxID=57926 RepID=UPI002176895C|nr:cucumber peeling cupredoxin-like [Potentilla anserina]